MLFLLFLFFFFSFAFLGSFLMSHGSEQRDNHTRFCSL